MGFFKKLGSVFGIGSSGEKPQTYGGERPIRSIKDVEEGKKYVQTVEDRLAGIATGYDEAFLNEATAPYATKRRTALKQETIPLISAQASSRGLGRSSIPVNRIAVASQGTEQDIMEKIAQLEYANQQQKRAEIADALNKYGNIANTQVGLENQARNFDYNEWANIQAQRQQRNQNQLSGIKNLIGLGSNVVGGFLTGGGSGTTGTGTSIYSQPLNLIQQILNQRNAAMVNR